MAASQQDILDYLQRYQDLVDDWDAFTAAMVQPQPTCIWRTEKFPRELFQQWLAQQDLLDAAKEQHCTVLGVPAPGVNFGQISTSSP